MSSIPKLRNSDVIAEGSMSRGRFLKRAGAASLALAAIGEVVKAPVANAASRRTMTSNQTVYHGSPNQPDGCLGEIVCTRCNGCCGSPCQPPGVGYCYHCVASNCGSSYYRCYTNEPVQFNICCN